jgi:RNA polymerase sigma-70 factor, ECF subfamily
MQNLYRSCTLFAMTSSPLTASDDDLMSRVAADDTAAFDEIYRRHRSAAMRVAMRIMRQPTAAEDVTQEAFLSLWRGASRYEPARSSLRAWLLLLVHSRGIDAIRRGRGHRTNMNLDDAPPERLHAPERTDSQAALREQSRHLRLLVGAIPLKQRQVIQLAYYKEMTQVEIAADLHLPLGTVKGRLRLAHSRLQRTLAAEEEEFAVLAS